MKKLLFFSLAICSLYLLSGQSEPLSVESDKVTILNNAKLGVGVAVPQEAIDVDGGLRLGTTSETNEGTIRYNGSIFQGYDGSFWLDLSSISPFERNGSVVRATGNYATDDFIFGRAELPQDGQNLNENLLFFDKDKGSFRAGRVQLSQNWAPDSIGVRSVAFGFNTRAKGLNSFAAGSNTSAIGSGSTALGNSNMAIGSGSFATGFNSKATGDYSFTLGYSVETPSYAEVAVGRFNTAYTADSETVWDVDDRIFVIGNGTTVNLRADALSLWKNGQMGLGVSNPDARLHIEADNSEDALLIEIGVNRQFFVAADGQVGIGEIDNPGARLQIDAEMNEDALLVNIDADPQFTIASDGQVGIGNMMNPIARLHIESDEGEDALRVEVDADRQFVVASDGQVAIGDINPDAKLYVESAGGEDLFRVRTGFSTKFMVQSNGGIRNTAAAATFALQLQNSATDLLGRGQAFSWNTFSDQRIKSNLQKLSYGITEIMQLEPLAYDHHDSEYFEDGRVIFKGTTTSKDIGLLAQETYKIIPEAVSKPEDERNSLWSMDYTRLVPVLISGMQEQQTQIEEMKTLIELQQSQLDVLTKLLSENKED